MSLVPGPPLLVRLSLPKRTDPRRGDVRAPFRKICGRCEIHVNASLNAVIACISRGPNALLGFDTSPSRRRKSPDLIGKEKFTFLSDFLSFSGVYDAIKNFRPRDPTFRRLPTGNIPTVNAYLINGKQRFQPGEAEAPRPRPSQSANGANSPGGIPPPKGIRPDRWKRR